MKRSTSGFLVVAALVGLGVAAGLLGRARSRAPLSILLLTVDTLRADRVGCYGHAAARTPAMDSLAAEGVLCADAATASPLTLPSHATILTGLLPPRHGLRDNDAPLPLPPAAGRSFRTLPEVLRERGWQTGAFVSASPLAPRWGLDAGFDTYDPSPEAEPGSLHLGEREGGITAEAALGWLSRRDRRRPFLLWVHLFDPHHPYAAPGRTGHPSDSPAAYDEEVAHADLQVRRLLDRLREEGVLDRTVVALTSDHGEGLGDHGETTHGHFLHRSTMHVPLLLRLPGALPAGTRFPGAVSTADLYPTLLDLAGVPLPGPVDGRSLLPALRGGGDGAAGEPSSQYGETLYGWRAFRWAQSVTARGGDRRVIDFGGDRRRVYDLASDPGEERDLAGSPLPADAALAERAWALFLSPPLHTAPPEGGDPGIAGIGYVSPFSPVEVLPPADNGALPLPSVSFLGRFDTALRILRRAALEEVAADASTQIQSAREVLGALEAEQPRNPALPFWTGRAWRQEGKITGEGAVTPWKEAFALFQEAGRRGYREPRTVSLMLEAAWHSREFKEMLSAARLAVEEARMDGDAGFWTWVGLAWWHGARGPDGRPTTEGRTRALEALDRAEARARGEMERSRIREVRASFQ